MDHVFFTAYFHCIDDSDAGLGEWEGSIYRSSVRSFLVTNVTASAEPPLNQAEARRCSTIVDDEMRLRCFDDLFSTKRSERNATGNVGAQSSWSIIESTSPTDNSSQLSAAMVVSDAALILRCREQKTEAAYSTRDTYLGDETVTVRFRIDLQEPVKEVWRSSMNGRAALGALPTSRDCPQRPPIGPSVPALPRGSLSCRPPHRA